MKRGRPFEPSNKFGRGRPKGSRNKRTLLLQELLDEHAPALMRKCLVMALQGDGPLLRLLLGTKLPRPLDAAVKIGRLPLNTTDELSHAHRTVLNKLTSGLITPTQAQQIDALLESHRRFLETENLAKRLQSLEDLHGSK